VDRRIKKYRRKYRKRKELKSEIVCEKEGE
jgi:hypothetical protein